MVSRVEKLAKPAEIVGLIFAAAVFEVSTSPEDLTIRVVAAKGRLHLSLTPQYSNLLVHLSEKNSTSGGGDVQPFGVREDQSLGIVLGDKDCCGRAASTALARPSAVVKLFFGKGAPPMKPCIQAVVRNRCFEGAGRFEAPRLVPLFARRLER